MDIFSLAKVTYAFFFAPRADARNHVIFVSHARQKIPAFCTVVDGRVLCGVQKEWEVDCTTMLFGTAVFLCFLIP